MRYWVVVDNQDKSVVEQILSYNPGDISGKTVFSTLHFEQPGNPVRFDYYTVTWDGNTPTLVKQDDEAVNQAREQRALEAWRKKTHCGPLQFRRALRAAGLIDSVKTYLETADEEVVEAWEYATKVDRNDPFVLAVGQLLNKTEKEVDALFNLALTFP